MKNIARQLITSVMNRQVSKLDELYQRHAGEECYIFGDGISLKWMDLHRFANKPSIIGNMLIYHKDVRALRIPYCSVIEPLFFYPVFLYKPGKKLRVLKHHLHKEYKKSISQNPDTLFFIDLSNYPVARFSNALFVSGAYKPPFGSKNPFRDRFDAHQGTLKFQLSLAIYLGFEKAYLVGHDYTHFPSRSLHFYNKGEGIPTQNRLFCQEFISYAKQHIDLVTVTLNAGSETMNYITYEELTGEEPKYRENIELVDRVKLENLATWHACLIF